MKDPSKIKVLVACEESQRVCMAFRERGFTAYSCDIQEPSGGHPEWHIRGDALKALRMAPWDLLIAHPPCTYLSNAGACRLYRNIDGESYARTERVEKGIVARDFFMAFYNAPIPHVAVENPVPTGMWHLPGYSQIIQPYYFGDPYTKKTCLWLWDLPELKPTDTVKPIGAWVQGGKKSGNGGYTKGVSHRSPKIRAKTFPGIAKAMSEQWGDYLMEVNNNAL